MQPLKKPVILNVLKSDIREKKYVEKNCIFGWSTEATLHLSAIFHVPLRPFCPFPLTNAALAEYILSARLSAHPPSVSRFPSLAPLHPGK